MLSAAKEHHAHAIGMSGLLVKSTVVMRENLEEMSRQGLEIPVLLGGAALTRGYVEDDCVRAYACGRVAYGRDAFDGLHLMDKVVGNGVRRLPGRGAGQARRQGAQSVAHAGPGGCARVPPGGCRHGAGAAPAADARRPVGGAAVLGRAGDRGGTQGDRAVRQRAQPVPVPVGLPEAGPFARRFPRLGEAGAASGDAAHAGAVRGGGHPAAAGRVRLLAGGGPGQRPDHLRRRTAARNSPASPCRASRRRTANASPTSSATSTTPNAT